MEGRSFSPHPCAFVTGVFTFNSKQLPFPLLHQSPNVAWREYFSDSFTEPRSTSQLSGPAVHASAAVSTWRPNMVVHHLFPPSLAPQFPWEEHSGLWLGGLGWWVLGVQLSCGCHGWQQAAALLQHCTSQRVKLPHDSDVWGQSKPRVCCKVAKTWKVISPVTATNWNHDVSRGGTTALLINDRLASAE